MELSVEQMAFFEESGFLMVPGVFSQLEIETMRAESAALLEFLINSSLANGRTSGRLDIRETSRGFQVRKIQPIVDISRCFRAIATDEKVVGPIRQIQEAEPELMEEKFTYKQTLPSVPAGLKTTRAEARFLIHNDYAYHEAHGYPTTIVTCGILIDESPRDSGPFHVWPGTHKKNLKHEPVGEKSYQVPATALDPNGGGDIIAKAGSVVFFSDLLVHNSGPNLSPQPRRMLFFSYMPHGSVSDSDARNRPVRMAEAPFEAHYRAEKENKRFVDLFQAPVD